MKRKATWLIGAWILYALALLSHYVLLAPGRTFFVLIAALAGPVLGYGVFCFVKNWQTLGHKNNAFILAVVVGVVLGITSFWLSLP